VSELRAEYGSTPVTPAPARRDVTRWATTLPEDARVDLVIAVNELVTNSVRRGPSDADTA
jgi:two-component sensor histidine kinase